MNYNVNFLIDRYYEFVNTVSKKNNYDENISHLIRLLLIVFVIKYDIKNEKIIMECFEKTKIIVSDNKKNGEEAFFYRNISLSDRYISNKYIIINDFYKENYIELIDTLIHEFNHAINSMVNEISFDEKNIYLRTGLSYLTYSKDDLNNAIDKSNEYVLEEVINTSQTVDIINIIKSIEEERIDSLEFSNFIHVIKEEVSGSEYVSKAYLLETKLLEPLINNRTFISTIENMRFMGKTNEIDIWFDSISNIKGQYMMLNKLLKELFDLELVYINRKVFKKDVELNIRKKINNVKVVVELFNNNCIYR